MSSRIVTQKNSGDFSVTIGKQQNGKATGTAVEGLYHQRVVMNFGDVIIDSESLDCEFDIPFDDNTEANEAELTIYNLSYDTTNRLNSGGTVTVKAGYGIDTGVIFSGRISDKKVVNEDGDRIITIKAIDGAGLSECAVEVSYCAGNTAQGILYDLCARLGFPIVAFEPLRDTTYDKDVTVDGSLMDAIEKYAGICGVSAYVCKGALYVRPLSSDGTDTFELSVETGLLSVEEYEKTRNNGDFEDIERGFTIEMLLNYRIQTGSKVILSSDRANGIYYVSEGEHTFDGTDMITKIIVLEG
jgi:hypothetical protein